MKTTRWEIERQISNVVEETQGSLEGIVSFLGKNYLKVYGDYDKYSSWIDELEQALRLIKSVEENISYEKNNHYV